MLRTSSFSMMRILCTSTVRGLMPSAAPIFLGVQAVHGVFEHLALARRKACELRFIGAAQLGRAQAIGLERERGVDRLAELRVEGFSMKSTAWARKAARAAGTSPCAVMMTKGWRCRARVTHRLQLDAAQARQAQIGEHAAGPVRARRRRESSASAKSRVV